MEMRWYNLHSFSDFICFGGLAEIIWPNLSKKSVAESLMGLSVSIAMGWNWKEACRSAYFIDFLYALCCGCWGGGSRSDVGVSQCQGNYDIPGRDVNFREFYFSIREFQISRLVQYSKVETNVALGMDNALNAWMLQLSRYHATRLWLGSGPWEVERWTGSCSGVKLQVSLMYSCLVRPDRHTAVIRNSSHAVAVIASNEQPESRWQVGPCVQFTKWQLAVI